MAHFHPVPDRWSRRRLAALVIYVVLVALSNLTTALRPSPPPAPPTTPAGAVRFNTTIALPAAGDVNLSALKWSTANPRPGALPVILMHGGPGQARDFAGFNLSESDPGLARMLADGRDVYAIDLLGFGGSTRDVPDYSMLANARAALAWMQTNSINRAHVLGWSQGGGVVLHMADEAPDRIASVTLAAAVAMQETEGSRSYGFEHARYAVGDWARVWMPRLLPHFGLLSPAPPAFTRYFSDSDQRPLGDVLRRLKPPLLILHGRKDFLIPHWAAIEHARAAPRDTTRVIMTPWSHFIPFWSIDKRRQTAAWFDEFWTQAEGQASAASSSPRGLDNPVTVTEGAAIPRLFGAFGAKRAELIVLMPWWSIASIIALLSARRSGSPRWSIALAAMLVVCGLVDYAVIWLGLVLGGWIGLAKQVRRTSPTSAAALPPAVRDEWRLRSARGAVWCGAMAVLRPDLRPEFAAAVRSLGGWRRLALLAGAAVAIMAQRLLLLVVALIIIAVIVWDPFHPLREFGILLALVAARLAIGVADHLLTIPGRRGLRATLARLRRFEFWPTWLVYLCLGPTFVRQTLRTGHPLAFTACNPGIESGGGVIGESKFTIMRTWRQDAERTAAAGGEAALTPSLAAAICRTWLLPPDEPGPRLARLEALLADPANELTYPIVLKPDAGLRGFAVRIVRSRDDAARALALVPTPLLVQPWHPGPGEVGVVWMRGAPGDTGHIFSITLKRFAVLEGDGRHSIEELIWRDPRHRLQASTFLARFAGRRLELPPAGAKLPLALAGNHCQGTLFLDGASLITPELEAAIDQLVRAYRSPADALDMVRLDIRYRDEAALEAGLLDRDSIVELNGTLGESTNIYDPNRPVSWALGVLRRQWVYLYQRGGERMRAGHRPMSIPGILAAMWKHYRTRRGSAVAD